MKLSENVDAGPRNKALHFSDVLHSGRWIFKHLRAPYVTLYYYHLKTNLGLGQAECFSHLIRSTYLCPSQVVHPGLLLWRSWCRQQKMSPTWLWHTKYWWTMILNSNLQSFLKAGESIQSYSYCLLRLCYVVNEVYLVVKVKLPPVLFLWSLERKVKEIMHTAFWDCLEAQLKEDPPAYGHVIKLVAEIKEARPRFVKSVKHWAMDMYFTYLLPLAHSTF